MSKRIEILLSDLTPREAPDRLRSATLAAVDEALACEAPRVVRRRSFTSRWDVRCTAAALLLLFTAVLANVWVATSSEGRLAEFRPTPSSEAPSRRGASMSVREYALRNEQVLREILAWEKGICYDSPQEDPEVDRHRPLDPYRGSSLDQRDLGVSVVRAA